MFTGIIETTGKIEGCTGVGTNKIFGSLLPYPFELKSGPERIPQRVCLTIEAISNDNPTNLQLLKPAETSLWTSGGPVSL